MERHKRTLGVGGIVGAAFLAIFLLVASQGRGAAANAPLSVAYGSSGGTVLTGEDPDGD